MSKTQSLNNARRLLRQSELGVLSTHSKANVGFPFGSVTTFMSTAEGEPIFYISDLAQHTRNVLDNPKMCFTVFSGSEATEDDANAGARLSILGEAAEIGADEVQHVAKRFYALYPKSEKYQNTHDFKFFKLKCHRVRFIGGFGDINWICKENWLLPSPEWFATEESLIKHMNEDHLEAMQLICEHNLGLNGEHISMLALNPDGCFFSIDQSKPVYLSFSQHCSTGKDVRVELVRMTNDARAALASKTSE